jgi:hypothetical protein
MPDGLEPMNPEVAAAWVVGVATAARLPPAAHLWFVGAPQASDVVA